MTVNGTPATPPRQLTLLAHVDATPSDLHSPELNEIESFESVVRPDTDVLVEVRREPTRPGRKILTGLLGMGAGAALGLGALSALGLPGFIVGGTATALGLLGAKRVFEGIRDKIDSAEPEWQGTRTYHIEADKQARVIDSPVVAQKDDTEASARALGHFFRDGMKQYPAQVTAVLVGGHGLAWDGAGGFSVSEIGRAVKLAGQKPDLLILEACLMGNLEALAKLSDSARYAVVSEETMGAYGLPWKEIMPALPASGLTAESLGRLIVQKSSASDEIDTLALVDLSRVKGVATKLEDLAAKLRQVVAKGGADEVRGALTDAARFPAGSGFLMPDLRDVGQVAKAVRTHVHDVPARQAALDLEKALEDAVVVGAHSPGYRGVSHFTVQGKGMKASTRPYERTTGFKEWGALLDEIKPWPSRLFGAPLGSWLCQAPTASAA